MNRNRVPPVLLAVSGEFFAAVRFWEYIAQRPNGQSVSKMERIFCVTDKNGG